VFTCAVADLPRIRPTLTMVGGEVVARESADAMR
jgi:hypothetical protein